jgi:hypothetical protein
MGEGKSRRLRSSDPESCDLDADYADHVAGTTQAELAERLGVPKRTSAMGWLCVLSTAFLLAGLLLASVWDGDGNPNTENLPQFTVTLAPRTARTADEQTDGDKDNDFFGQLLRPTRRRRHLLLPHELSWRRIAVPSRGPPTRGLR